MENCKRLCLLALGLSLCVSFSFQQGCERSVTKINGRETCKGALIFEDEFDFLDLDKWNHEITMAGGGNWEFQLYYNNRSHSFTQDSTLHIRPGLTEDQYGLDFLSNGVINLWGGAPADQCTNPSFYGCERIGNPVNILNPIKSARLRTVNSFSFKYGTVEVRAKMPAGDWLWPAVWFMPQKNAYGTWPLSGEIDLTESRGNLNLMQGGKNIGAEMTGSTLHFGPFQPLNGYEKTHFELNSPAGQGFDKDFHLYQMEWTPDFISFSVDNVEIGRVTPPAGGFWELGDFANLAPGSENPWRFGTKMAPFDQEFYMIINLAAGGIAYFPDDAENPGGKPWSNTSPQAMLDFLNGRGQWEPTWNLNVNEAEAASLQVDYVRVWAL